MDSNAGHAVIVTALLAAVGRAVARLVGVLAGLRRPRPVSPGRLVEAVRPAVLAEIADADAALARVLERPAVRSLAADELARIAASVATARVLLTQCAAGARSAPSHAALAEVSRLVRGVSADNHRAQVDLLRQLRALDTAAAVHALVVHELETVASGPDEQWLLSPARDALDEVGLAIGRAREATLSVSATTSRRTVHERSVTIDSIRGMLDHAVTEILAAERVVEPTAVC